MVEPHLLSPALSTLRRLALFFVLGAALFFAKRAWLAHAGEASRPLLVRVPSDAAADEVERAVREALLVEEALRVAPAVHDPVVRAHLLAAMRPSSDERRASDDELVERALALGMARADPVIRQRLAFQMEQLLIAGASREPASDGELAAFFARHRERYREPARVSLVHVFLSRSRRGERVSADAARLRRELERDELGDRAALALGDPTLLPRELTGVSTRELATRFGASFARDLEALPVGRWSGPVSSSYGLHLVRVRERLPGRDPALVEVRTRVAGDFEEDRRAQTLARELSALRARYRIDLVRERS